MPATAAIPSTARLSGHVAARRPQPARASLRTTGSRRRHDRPLRARPRPSGRVRGRWGTRALPFPSESDNLDPLPGPVPASPATGGVSGSGVAMPTALDAPPAPTSRCVPGDDPRHDGRRAVGTSSVDDGISGQRSASLVRVGELFRDAVRLDASGVVLNDRARAEPFGPLVRLDKWERRNGGSGDGDTDAGGDLGHRRGVTFGGGHS